MNQLINYCIITQTVLSNKIGRKITQLVMDIINRQQKKLLLI